MAKARPTRRRQQLEIDPLNWVAPDARKDLNQERTEQDTAEQDTKKLEAQS